MSLVAGANKEESKSVNRRSGESRPAITSGCRNNESGSNGTGGQLAETS